MTQNQQFFGLFCSRILHFNKATRFFTQKYQEYLKNVFAKSKPDFKNMILKITTNFFYCNKAR